jgi:hypothetical protein
VSTTEALGSPTTLNDHSYLHDMTTFGLSSLSNPMGLQHIHSPRSSKRLAQYNRNGACLASHRFSFVKDQDLICVKDSPYSSVADALVFATSQEVYYTK